MGWGAGKQSVEVCVGGQGMAGRAWTNSHAVYKLPSPGSWEPPMSAPVCLGLDQPPLLGSVIPENEKSSSFPMVARWQP